MIDIIPALLARTQEEFERKAQILRALGEPVHVDVMDGAFVPERTWSDPKRMQSMLGGLPFDVHLMVVEPERHVPDWLAAGARKVLFHIEATTRVPFICRSAAIRCEDLVVAVNPETPIERLAEALTVLHGVMLMGVTPGRSGQAMSSGIVAKIRELRRQSPTVRILVDGGVKPENAAMLMEAGANELIAGSAIVDQPDRQAAFERLLHAVGQK